MSIHYENDVYEVKKGQASSTTSIATNLSSWRDLSNITMTRSYPKEVPSDFCWLPWLMTETKGLQYLWRQTSAKIHPSTAMHRLTRCFLHSCLSSWQGKIISFVQLPLLKWHRRLCGRSQSKRERRRGMRPQSVPRNWNCVLFLGEEGKGIWPVPDWFCSPSCPKLSFLYLKTVSWLTAQPHLSAGWGLSILWDTHYKDALTQLSLPASLSHMAHTM